MTQPNSQLKQTPSQTVGPYFAYGLVPGEHIAIVGNVFDAEGKVVNDALIEIAQADANGRYVQSAEEARESGFRGFARCGTGTDPKRRFIFDTVKPGVTAADSAPHLDVIVLMRGMLLHCYKRIYFEDEEAANAKDTVLQSVPAERRHTLIAKREAGAAGKSGTIYRFDVHLRGPNETGLLRPVNRAGQTKASGAAIVLNDFRFFLQTAMTDDASTPSPLYARLLGETAQIGWSEPVGVRAGARLTLQRAPFSLRHNVVLLMPSAAQAFSRSPSKDSSTARTSSACVRIARAFKVRFASSVDERVSTSGAISMSCAAVTRASSSSTAMRSITFCNSRTLPGQR